MRKSTGLNNTQELIDLFVEKKPEYKGKIIVVKSLDERLKDVCCLDVSSRTYKKNYLQAEVEFLKEHIPLIKFTPDGEPPFVVPQQEIEAFSD